MSEIEVGELIRQVIRILPDAIKGMKSIFDRARREDLPQDQMESLQAEFEKERDRVEQAMSIIDEIREKHFADQKLIQELSRRQAFESQLERYQLTKTSQGHFVYKLKEDRGNGEPIHYICADCVQRKKKSLLHEHGEHALRCNSCQKIFEVSHNPNDDPGW